MRKYLPVILSVVFVLMVAAFLLIPQLVSHTVVPVSNAAQVREASAPPPVARGESRPAVTSRGTPIIYDDDVPEDISWQDTPQSDCFSRVGYCAGTETLGVTFRESGSTYYYYSVPSSIWKDLSSADSPGSYYNKHIKGKYTCEKEG